MREIPQMSDAILIHDQKGGFVSDGIEWFTDGKCSRVEIYVGGGERVSTLNRGYLDYIKGRGPFHGSTTSTYRDGSVIVSKWQEEATVSEWKRKVARRYW